MNNKFSVVVSTVNRVEELKRCLLALAQQTYDNFEIVLVAGPSSDGTDELVRLVSNVRGVRIASVDAWNLSASRNIGITHSGGDIVAFIDDDAQASPFWLEDLSRAFSAGATGSGGLVYDSRPTEGRCQFARGVVSSAGDIFDVLDRGGDLPHHPGEEWFPRFMGTNMAFRRTELIRVGGFDEFYEYIHDETDLCVRMHRRGSQKFVFLNNAVVFHFPANSHNRQSWFNINWYAQVKNGTYFALKNRNKGRRHLVWAIRRAVGRYRNALRQFRTWYRSGDISGEEFAKFSREARSGMLKGATSGIFSARRVRFFEEIPSPLIALDRSDLEGTLASAVQPQESRWNPLRIVLTSHFIAPESAGGVGAYTHHLASEYAKLGHEVHVITGQPVLTAQRNYRVHLVGHSPTGFMADFGRRLPQSLGKFQYSVMVLQEFRRISDQFGRVDILESPIWDVEGVVPFMEIDDVVRITRLETPYHKVRSLREAPWNDDDDTIVGLEQRQLDVSDGIVSISDQIASYFFDHYTLHDSKDFRVIPLPVPDMYFDIGQTRRSGASSGSLTVLYVGRLEERKGTRIFLDSLGDILDRHPLTKVRIVGQDNSLHDGFFSRYGLTYEGYCVQKWGRRAWKDQIVFCGEISQDDVLKEYRSADVFACPSLFESFGLIYIEAMASGLPMVVIDNPITASFVADEKPSAEVASAVPKAFAEAVNRLLDNPELRKSLAAAGKQRALAYRAESLARENVRFYQEAMARKVNHV